VNHHERLSNFQVTFYTQVNELVAAIAEMGNSLIKDNYCLFALYTKDMSTDVVNTIKGIIDLEQQQYTSIKEEFLMEEKSISEPNKRNKLALLSKKRKLRYTKKSVLVS
jgi:hypothetical protein